MIYSQKTISKEKFQKNQPELYNIISNYYPLKLDSVNEDYLVSSEYKRLLERQKQKIFNQKKYELEWHDGFCGNLIKLIKKKVTPKTHGISPSRNCSVILSHDLKNKTSVTIEIYLSLIGNFYNIEVIEWIICEEGQKPQLHPNKVWVSPTKPHLDIWRKIESFINSRYSNYSFLPFRYEMLIVKNLALPHSLNSNNSIHSGFFLKSRKYQKTTSIIGDINY